MAAQLTEWENEHMKSIYELINSAAEIEKYFKDKENRLDMESKDKGKRPDMEVKDSKDWMKFRIFCLDLYSALDYTWYLLYCHFSNGGKCDLTRNGTMVGFPSRPSGVKRSDSNHQDHSAKFKEEKVKRLWKDRFRLGSHFYKIIGDTILDLQPKINVDGNGDVLERIKPAPGTEQESFLLLHFYRNCVAHRDFIYFAPKKMRVEINQKTRETRLIPSEYPPLEQAGYYHQEIDRPGYWIQLPDLRPKENNLEEEGPSEGEQRLLLDVLKQLMRSVKGIIGRLLHGSMMIPTAQRILEDHVPGLKIHPNHIQQKRSNEKLELEVRASHEEKGLKFSATCTGDSFHSAVDKCLADILRQLQTALPPSSFSCPHLTTYERRMDFVLTPPPKEIKLSQNSLQMINQYKQKVDADPNFTVEIPFDEPQKDPLDEQLFSTQLHLSLVDANKEIVMKLSSGEKKGKGKQAAKEEAAKTVFEELRLFGLIIVIP